MSGAGMFMISKHGHCGGSVGQSPTYHSYRAMLKRCYDTGNSSYPDYGGAGITICDAWRNSFEAFLADMGVRPEGCTLDRFPDKNGNYEPGNVRWATRKEQQNNLRTNIIFDGKTISQHCEERGISKKTIFNRMKRGGLTLEQALEQPIKSKRKGSSGDL